VPSSTAERTLGYYSFLRYVGDPLRDEAINVGLFLVSGDGRWARFGPHVTKQRIEAIGHADDIATINRWIADLVEAYDLRGDRGLLGEPVNRDGLLDWAHNAGGMLRLTEPRVALDHDMEALWRNLWRRYIRRGRGPDLGDRRAPTVPTLTGAQEREMLVNDFVTAASSAPNFDPSRISKREQFRGTRLYHVADIAIRNGEVAAVGQAIPFVHGSELEVIERRALIVDAALDLPREIEKFAIYEDPPPEKADVLNSTRRFFGELGPNHRIEMYPSRRFDELVAQMAPRLFPTSESD
jgi:hypothetical protein